jgi:hypothetical protein
MASVPPARYPLSAIRYPLSAIGYLLAKAAACRLARAVLSWPAAPEPSQPWSTLSRAPHCLICAARAARGPAIHLRNTLIP